MSLDLYAGAQVLNSFLSDSFKILLNIYFKQIKAKTNNKNKVYYDRRGRLLDCDQV